MINNEKQYKISKRKLRELNAQIDKISKDTAQNPLRNQLIRASLNNSKKEIENEISRYETLKKKNEGVLNERLIAELPSVITEYKIVSGLTQKQLSHILGLKEQQLQRYEATGFKSVTFKKLLKFLDMIGLEIKIKETRLSGRKKIATG
ncbi:MAG: helix-turn-helix transcriptional regulator [Bacteroidetes bacterium]|nr:helix-turn-helix transcriptional regulator [Bacteroidota bacterium]